MDFTVRRKARACPIGRASAHHSAGTHTGRPSCGPSRSYAQAAKVVAFYRDQVIPLHESNLILAEAGFTAGAADLTALLDVQRELIDARLKQAAFERDSGLAEAELSRAVGGALLIRGK